MKARANQIERLIEGNEEILGGTGKALEYLRAVSRKDNSLQENSANGGSFGKGIYEVIINYMGDVLDELRYWRVSTWGSKDETDIRKGQIYRDVLDLSEDYKTAFDKFKELRELEKQRKEDELEEQLRRAEREEEGLPSWDYKLIVNSNQVSNSNTS